jgi:response regulator of citrate/malate metabolism
MSETKSASQQLDEAIKAAEAAAQKVEELKKATREEDLRNVLALISRHGFTQTDLKSALKIRGASAKVATGAKRPYVRKKK